MNPCIERCLYRPKRSPSTMHVGGNRFASSVFWAVPPITNGIDQGLPV